MGEQPQAPAAFRTATDFPASTHTLVPSGAKARVRANIAAIELLDALRDAGRPATVDEQPVLAAWSGWGAVPEVFDPRNDTFTGERQQLRDLLIRGAVPAGRSVGPQRALHRPRRGRRHLAGHAPAPDSPAGRVLEPGCGSGTFIGHAPDDAVMVGVENDAITAAIAALALPLGADPQRRFRNHPGPGEQFRAHRRQRAVRPLRDRRPSHNPRGHSIHNHFISKSLALIAPGGYVAVLTSRYTMDSAETAARHDMAARADLIGALRLPSKRSPESPAPRSSPTC